MNVTRRMCVAVAIVIGVAGCGNPVFERIVLNPPTTHLSSSSEMRVPLHGLQFSESWTGNWRIVVDGQMAEEVDAGRTESASPVPLSVSLLRRNGWSLSLKRSRMEGGGRDRRFRMEFKEIRVGDGVLVGILPGNYTDIVLRLASGEAEIVSVSAIRRNE